MTKRQVTRARAKAPSDREQKAERIAFIADMMRRLEWKRGKSAPVLAERWGLSVGCVESYSAEARRIVCREVTDPERVRADVSTVLLENLERASDAGEFRAVASLGDVVTRIVGARSPERIDLSSRSDEELLARWQELTGHPYSGDQPS